MAAQFQDHSNKPLDEMMRNLNIDPAVELTDSNMAASKDQSQADTTSCVSSMGDATGCVKESDVDREPLRTDQGWAHPRSYYYGYYYPGYDGSFPQLSDKRYYMVGEGIEFQYPEDNSSLVYFMPGFQPGYLPLTAIGVDGQYAGQHPSSPGLTFQPSVAAPVPGYYHTPLVYGELVPSPYLWDPSHFVGNGMYGNGWAEVLDAPGFKPNVSLTSDTRAHSKNKSDVVDKGYFPSTKFSSYNQGKGGVVCPSSSFNLKANSRGWVGAEKPKTRSKPNSITDLVLINEKNHGPRTAIGKDALVFEGNAVGSLVTEENEKSNNITSLVRRDQYNVPDFPTKYDHAFFFVIKSYSEDDIHKSIKYNVWASTPNGNKRLDTAYQDAQERMREKGSKCPVFLFFSVNASGQFCGVAEMIGRVDFNKSMDFWQQDKWNGYFPVKWHIIKDVPNPQLRHIILENNENKPVTNSRDTQEIKFIQGIEMLNIFKNYSSKTSILDDFDFYESRQKVMQEKRIKTFPAQFDPIRLKEDEVTTSFKLLNPSAVENIGEQQVAEKTKE